MTTIALAVAMLALTAVPAQAGYETLKRSVENMVWAPFDLVTAPVVAGKSVVNNLQNIDDTMGVRVAYTVPGFLWLTGVQAGASLLRAISGGLELPVGIALLPFPGLESDALFDPSTRADALVDVETPPHHIKFGVDYTSTPQ
jgi:hypothetical protein